MSNAQTAKTLTQLDAINKINNIIYVLLTRDLNFIFNSFNGSYKFIAVKDIHNVKYHFPEFEIKQDERKRQYAELVINYE